VIRKFLGLAGYYWQFIKGFSTLASPMIQLLRKDTSFTWKKKSKKSFQELKKRLMTTLVLSLPEKGKLYALYIDASKEGLGAMLM
jgi:hypothetical protein